MFESAMRNVSAHLEGYAVHATRIKRVLSEAEYDAKGALGRLGPLPDEFKNGSDLARAHRLVRSTLETLATSASEARPWDELARTLEGHSDRPSDPSLAVECARECLRLLGTDPELDALSVGGDEDQFRLGGAPWVRLPRAQGRMLRYLARYHAEQPGIRVPYAELVEAGWPGEKMLRKSASIRLRNAVARMRSAGLRDILLTSNGGYLLDPSRGVKITSSGTDGSRTRRQELPSTEVVMDSAL